MMIRQTHIRKLILLSTACFCCVLGSCGDGIVVSELKYTQNSINVKFQDLNCFLWQTFDLIDKRITNTDSIVNAIDTILNTHARIEIVNIAGEFYSVNNRRLHVYKMLSAKHGDFTLPGRMFLANGKYKNIKEAKEVFARKKCEKHGHTFTADKLTKGKPLILKGPSYHQKKVEEYWASFEAPDVVEAKPELLDEPSMKSLAEIMTVMKTTASVVNRVSMGGCFFGLSPIAPEKPKRSPSLQSDGGSTGTFSLSDLTLRSKSLTPSTTPPTESPTPTESPAPSSVKPVAGDDSPHCSQPKAKAKAAEKADESSGWSTSDSSEAAAAAAEPEAETKTKTEGDEESSSSGFDDAMDFGGVAK